MYGGWPYWGEGGTSSDTGNWENIDSLEDLFTDRSSNRATAGNLRIQCDVMYK